MSPENGLSLGPVIMELNWGNGSRVCAADDEYVKRRYIWASGCSRMQTYTTLPKFPGSLQCQDSGHHPWEGPALSHFCGAWQWYKADHWDKVSICEWFQHWQNNCSKLVLMVFFWCFLHNYSDLRFLLSSPLIKPDIFSQTRSSWILAGWLNGTAQQKEDLSLIQGTRLALKEPRNQDHKTGNGSPMLFSQRYYSPF